MAGEEAAEGSRTRIGIDLNLYVGLPPLPPPRVNWLDTSAASPTTLMPSSTVAAQEARSSFEAVAMGQNPDGGGNQASGSGAAEEDGSGDRNSSFECNICLDAAKLPVVTSCGHLFCWPCLYRWLRVESPLCECPVCKGQVLRSDITPIYGRGGETATANPDLPPRPGANRRDSLRQQLQMARDSRELTALLRQMIRNQQGIETSDNNMSRSMPHSNGNNAEQVVLAAPQQPSSVQQLSTSSMGEPGPSRRSRPSESRTTRRTRRRP